MDKRVVTEMLDCSHRCDRCGSQAYVLAVLDISDEQRRAGVGDELYMCAHHWREHQPRLEPLCGLIVDETHRLFEHVQDSHWVEGQEASHPSTRK